MQSTTRLSRSITGGSSSEDAKEPKTFIEFSGEHGINSDVDDRILMQWAQIYATRG